MSTGSNNIVVQVTDGVDANIAPKIRDIGTAARDAQGYLTQLQTSLNAVTGGANNLGAAVSKLPQTLNQTTQGASRFEGALAQLGARVLGMEAGFGMLGGALGRVGVAAGIAGPIIVAALAIGAVIGAIQIYEKFEEAARKLALTQIALAEQFNRNKDTILQQKEELIGLTEGPLAKYAAELRDLPLKDIASNISNITKELKDQESTLAKVASAFQQYATIGNLAALATSAASGVAGAGISAAQPAFNIKDAIDFVQNSEVARVGSTDKLKSLQDALTATGKKLVELHDLEQQQTGTNLSITEVGRKAIQDYYHELTDDYTKYLGERKKLQLGADGEFLAEQRKAAAEELREFNAQVSQLKAGADVVSPQQILALRQKQLAQFDQEHPGDTKQTSPFAEARDTLTKDIGAAQQAIDRQDRSLTQLVQKYKDEVAGSENYSVALRTEIEQRKAAAEVLRLAPDNANAKVALDQINASIAAKVRDAETVKAETAIYNEFIGPVLKYNAAIDASNRLLSAGAITAGQAAIAKAQAARVEQDALSPLNEYVIGLEHEVALFGKYGTALTVATEVDRVRQELQKKGRDLTAAETTVLSQFLTQLERQRQIQQEINALYEQNAGAIQKLLIQQTALNAAVEKGVISNTQYKIATAQVNVSLAEQNLLEGKAGTVQNALVAGLGKVLDGYQGLAKGVSDAFGQAFKTIADGAANSLGRAIAYGEDLGKALENVARQVVSQLIAAFVKLGIQWLITEAVGKAVAESALAATIAEAEAVATAWAPAAAFASLATLGANAAPASAAVSGTVALSETLAVVTSKFANGGLVTGGSGSNDDVLAMLTGGEFVVNKQASAQHRELLEQINSGTSAISSRYAPTSAKAGSSVNVQVIHDGSTRIDVQKLDDGRVRIIARQEAEQAVQRGTATVIAADLQNPNSRTSKALLQNVEVRRRR